MHILFLTHWYPSAESPISGVFIYEHAQAVSSFHQVTVIHIQGISPQARRPLEIKKETGHQILTYHLSYQKPLLPKTAWIYRLIGVNQIIKNLFQSNNPPHLIHAHIYSSADLAWFFSRKYHIPAILSEHSSAFARRLLKQSQIKKACWYLNRLHLILPVSQHLADQLRGYGIKTPFQLVPNTFNPQIFFPRAADKDVLRSPFRVLVVARLDRNKAVDDLLRAAARLLPENNLEIQIVGDGPELPNLKLLCQQLNLSHQVTFLGSKTKPEIAALMRRADLLALTSHYDNQPVVLLEAMACGLPVLAPRVGGVPEILPEWCGQLITPADIRDIETKLLRMLENLSDYNPNVISAYAHQKFGYEAVGKRLDDVYRQVIQEYNKGK